LLITFDSGKESVGSKETKKIPEIHTIKGSQHRRSLFAITEILRDGISTPSFPKKRKSL